MLVQECYQGSGPGRDQQFDNSSPSSFSHSPVLFSGYLFSCVVNLIQRRSNKFLVPISAQLLNCFMRKLPFLSLCLTFTDIILNLTYLPQPYVHLSICNFWFQSLLTVAKSLCMRKVQLPLPHLLATSH